MGVPEIAAELSSRVLTEGALREAEGVLRDASGAAYALAPPASPRTPSARAPAAAALDTRRSVFIDTPVFIDTRPSGDRSTEDADAERRSEEDARGAAGDWRGRVSEFTEYSLPADYGHREPPRPPPGAMLTARPMATAHERLELFRDRVSCSPSEPALTSLSRPL
jgi:hypothetical protein